MAKIVSTLRQAQAKPDAAASSEGTAASSTTTALGILFILALVAASFYLVVTSFNIT